MDETARFALPQLAPGQAQKEWFHNEALQRVDLLLCPVVEGAASATPPPSPVPGSCYLIGPGATGAWAGMDGKLAGYTDGGWRFVAPIEGIRVLDRVSGQTIQWRNGAWETGIVRAQELRINDLTLVRQRQPAITNPAGGTIIDAECRAAVANMLAMLRTHGLIS
jgi:hypothetical protein